MANAIPLTTGPSICDREYFLHEVIGQGAQGIVHKGYTKDDHRKINPLAIKLYHDRSLKGLARARYEVTVLKATSGNPHVIDYMDYSLNQQSAYVVMEYIPETLYDRCRTDPATGVNRITQRVIETYLAQLPEIYGFFHTLGIAHCDFKSNNFAYSEGETDTLKVIDLGLAIPFRTLLLFSKGNAHSFYPPELRIGGIVTSTCDLYCAEKVLERMLIGSYFTPPTKSLKSKNLQDIIEEGVMKTIDYMELFHETTLPVSFKRLLIAMTADHALRPNPSSLKELVGEVLADIEGREVFKPQDFDNAEKMYYAEKSESSCFYNSGHK